MKSRAALILGIILLFLLAACSAGTDPNAVFLRNDTVFRYKEEKTESYIAPEGMVLTENPIPDYMYTVTLLDSDRVPLTDTHKLECAENVELIVQLTCDSSVDVTFGIMVFSSCIPIPTQADGILEAVYCQECSCGHLDFCELTLSFSPIWVKGYESLKIVVMEGIDTAVNASLQEKDYSFAVNVPFTVVDGDGTSALPVQWYSDGTHNVYDIRELFGTANTDENGKRYFEEALSVISSQALHTSLSASNTPSLTPGIALTLPAENEGTVWLHGFGQAGRYMTVLLADNTPVPAFDGKYCLFWEAPDPDRYLLAAASIHCGEAGKHTICALTFPLDAGNKPPVYDSYKIGMLWLGEGLQTSVLREKVSVLCGGVPLEEDLVLPYTSGEVTLDVSCSLELASVPRRYTLMVLCGGMLQKFRLSGTETEAYSFTLAPGESFSDTVSFSPVPYFVGDSPTEDLPIDVLFLPELTNINDHSLNTISSYQVRCYLHADFALSARSAESPTLLSSDISQYESENPQIRIGFQNTTDAFGLHSSSAGLIYTAYSLPAGRYLLFALANGVQVPLTGDSDFLTFSVTEQNQEIVFPYTFSPSEKDVKLVFVTVALNTSFMEEHPRGVGLHTIAVKQIGQATVSFGTVQTGCFADGESNTLCRSFVGFLPNDLPPNSIVFSWATYTVTQDYIDAYLNVYGYGYPGYLNVFSVTGNCMPICSDSSLTRIQSHTLHVFSPTEQGFTVARYKTPVLDS